MAVFDLQERRGPSGGRAALGDYRPAPSENHPTAAEERDVLGKLRVELDSYLDRMQGFAGEEPDQVLQTLSSIGARLTQIRTHAVRSTSRLARNFVAQELEPLIGQCEFQFRIHSRLLASRQLDWEMVRGQS